jgi:hypothetical protein
MCLNVFPAFWNRFGGDEAVFEVGAGEYHFAVAVE